jgi:hypothetical protein
MAKLTFPNQALAKYLHTHGDKIYLRQGSVVRRKRHKPPPEFAYEPSRQHFFRSEKRSEINAFTKDLSIRFRSLSEPQRSAWSTYATCYSQYKNGFQAFFSNNMRLIRPKYSGLVHCDDITSPPQTPSPPAGLSAVFIPSSSSYCVTWTSPNCVGLYVQCWQWLPPGFQRSRNWPFLYVSTSNSSNPCILIPAVFFSVGQRATLAARILNTRGEVSTMATIGSFIKTSFQPGIYGCVYYGYAYYGPEA